LLPLNQLCNQPLLITTATHSFAITGVPQTVLSGEVGFPQTVAGFVTVSPAPVKTTGEGGIDSPSAGSGLAAGKADLIADLFATFSKTSKPDGETPKEPDEVAGEISAAIEKFFMSAKIMTEGVGVSTGGGACPAPSGPLANEPFLLVSVGGIDQSTPGSTLGVSKTTLESTIEGLSSGSTPFPTDAQDAAEKWADAIELYFKEAKVDSNESGTASGGSATVSPTSGSGATSSKSTTIAGTGTGTLS
jgi:hypothetical protein